MTRNRTGSVKKRLFIAILVAAVAILVVLDVAPLGTVVLYSNKDTYQPGGTVGITVRSVRIGTAEFGRSFRVQWVEYGDWVEVPLDRWWDIDLLGLHAGGVFTQSLIPAEDLVDPAEPGKYRVVKGIRAGLLRLETQTLAAGFHVEEST
jgi:hypothetical protein